MPIGVTFFTDHFAKTKREAKHTISELLTLIAETTAGSKGELPWLKLATFGNNRSKHGSLRHDRNVDKVHGIEGDYDGEQIPFDEAVAKLRDADVESIVYTTPTHSPEEPRWRVLCPFDQVRLPEIRAQMVDRLNGVLGGVLAPESWAMSQGFYYGSVNGNRAHRVEHVVGRPIDLCSKLDATAIPSAKSRATANPKMNGELEPEDNVHHIPGRTPPGTLPKWLQQAIKTGKTKNSGTDKSRAVYAVARGLVQCGWDDKAIAAVLLNQNNKISEHVLKQGGGVVALRQAAQAREDETEHRAKQARKAAIPPNKVPIALGMTQEIRFAVAAHNTINTFSAQQLTTRATLLSLVTTLDYWVHHYPHPEIEGAFDSNAAGLALMAKCEEAGPFDPSRIRGRGVWREGDKIIVNFGDPIPSDVRHHYVCFDPLPITAGGEVEVQRLFKLLKMFRWRNKADPLLFLGLAACMPVCGALRWRPHGWLAGPRNAGKSTLVHLLTAITSPLSMALSGNTSEAGVRQSVGYDARGLIIDEFEQNEHVDSILGLARIASSGDVVVRGSGDGRPVRYQAFMMFLFASITIRGMGVADSTRIVRLELEKHTSKLKIRRKIESEVAYFERLGGDAWCRMMIDRLPVLLETINVIEGHVSADDDRHRKNMATLLAGGWIALHGRVPSGQEGRKFAQKAATTTAVHAEELVERDQDMECLARLFAHQVRSNNRGTYPLGHWIGVVAREFTEDRVGETVEEVIDARSIVASHDMRVEKDGLLIKNGSVAIDRIFEDTEWARGAWKQALRRIPGAGAVAKVVKFLSGANIPARATLIPFNLLPEPIDTYEEPM
jgi:hypothetical protein